MFDHPLDGVAEKQQWWCGRLMDGARFGQPGQQVKCRGQEFLIYPRGADVWTRCLTCQGDEDANLRRTAQRTSDPQGYLACERCGGVRFAFYDEGNEVQTKCVGAQCGHFAPLGVGKLQEK